MESESIAVKVVSTAGLAEKAQGQLRREIVLQARFCHENIAHLLGAYSTKGGHVHLIMRAYAGDLGSLLDGSPDTQLLRPLVPRLMSDLFSALRYLHDEQEVNCSKRSSVKPTGLLS